MADNLGTGVSRVLDPKQTAFLQTIWQQGKPPCDSELNLVQQLLADWRQQVVLRGTPSGWLGNETNPSTDFITNATWSNWFKYGRQKTNEKASFQWAVVNGWLIPVTGTQTGTPPGSPNNVDTWNKITLDPPPANSGDVRADFVFLEAWVARVAPGPATLNKPSASAVYRFGNVEGGYNFLADDIMDPAIGVETTQRVQIQYRIRVVKGLIGLATFPDGFDGTVVKARGAASADTAFTFANMRNELGDPGLWRAGDGTTNTLGTVDGYTYAIPIAVVFRRNGVVWTGDPSQNLNGGFNRNPTAVDRTGVKTFSTTPTLAAALGGAAGDTSLTLVSVANIPMPTAPATPVLIQIGDELMTYTTITGSVVSGLTRASNGTIREAHPIGATIKVISGRPDGLFADQIAATDVFDIRHVINPNGFDYNTLLQANLDKLMRGQLRANWKRSGGGPQGTFVSYQDKISATPAALGVTKLDSPDGIRQIFSDAAVQQPVEVIVKATGAIVSSPTVTAVNVAWSLTINASTTRQAVANVWTSEISDNDGLGDRILIPVAQFKNTVGGSDADQVRFLNDIATSGVAGVATGNSVFTDAAKDFTALGAQEGDSLVIYTGAAKGTYTLTGETGSTTINVTPAVPAAVDITYEIRKGAGAIQIRLDGSETPLALHRYKITPVNPGPNDDITIEFKGAGVISTVTNNIFYITTHIQYGAGRGLSRRPDSIHSLSIFNPNSELLVQPTNIPSNNFNLRTAWALLWSKFRGEVFKGAVPVTSEAFADLGSKTVILTPFRRVAFPENPGTTGVRTQDGGALNSGNGLMPLFESDGVTPKWVTTDPLGLFSGTTDADAARKNFYIQLPRHLVPGWGAVHVPILPANNATFHRGVNFMLQAQEGLNTGVTDASHNKQYINYTSNAPLSYASMSTGNFSGGTTVPATFNATFAFSGVTHAGARIFTDQRGLGRQGIELPPFYGIARMFAVYESADYKTNGSAFNASTREPTGSGATNLLRQNFTGATFWVEVDDDGDATFIVNADALDLTKSPTPIATFGSKHYVVEASIFGFDRGSFSHDQPFRLVLSRARDQANTGVRVNNVVSIAGPAAIIPGPLTASDTVFVNFSRTPYGGDPWGSQTNYVDNAYNPGSLQTATAYQIVSSSLDAATLTRPNQKALEVLASIGFSTTLGTGRLSGDVVASNAFDFRNVGYEDPSVFPPNTGVSARPRVLSGALTDHDDLKDGDASAEYLGCSDRLPLGALARDKDLRGARFRSAGANQAPLIYQQDSGVGRFVVNISRTKLLEQDEIALMPASVASGAPGDVIVQVDGEQGNYALLTNFRTYRGGSAFTGSGERPGGEVVSLVDDVYAHHGSTGVLVGRAYLVRNAPTNVGANEVSAGDELMMAIVVTTSNPSADGEQGVSIIGTNGTGEGSAAADLYRIEGHPILTNNVRYDVDPSTIVLPPEAS